MGEDVEPRTSGSMGTVVPVSDGAMSHFLMVLGQSGPGILRGCDE